MAWPCSVKILEGGDRCRRGNRKEWQPFCQTPRRIDQLNMVLLSLRDARARSRWEHYVESPGQLWCYSSWCNTLRCVRIGGVRTNKRCSIPPFSCNCRNFTSTELCHFAPPPFRGGGAKMAELRKVTIFFSNLSTIWRSTALFWLFCLAGHKDTSWGYWPPFVSAATWKNIV